MYIKLIIIGLYFLSYACFAQQIKVDLRHRPPEMSLSGENHSGPIIDIVELLLADSELEPQWLNVPWARTLLRAKLGQVDIVPRHSMTPEREKYLLPMLIGYEQRIIHYLLAPNIKNIDKYQSPRQFGNLIFGLLRGSYYGPYVKSIDSNTSTVFTNDINQLMSLLLTGRIDIMPIQNLSWAEAAYNKVKGKHPGKKYQTTSFQESFVSGKYLSIPKASPLATNYHQLNCKLFKLRDAGIIDKLYKQYLIPEYIQIFKNKESLKQLDSCLQYQKGLSSQSK